MSLSIQPVTKDNWNALIKLKVRDEEKSFVASNLYSIAESQFGYDEPNGGGDWDMHPYGIYEDASPVGFLMYGYNFSYANFQAFIMRLMVDENQQGRGYGKFGMEKMLEMFRQDERIKSVDISY